MKIPKAVWMFFLALPMLGGAGTVCAEQKIVSLSPALTEIVFAIGAGEVLQGVSRQCDYPLAAKLKPKFGDFNQPQIKKLKESGIHLVLFSEQVHTRHLKDLSDAGIGYRILPATTVADVLNSIRILGELTGAGTGSDLLAKALEADIRKQQERTRALPEAARPRVYLEIDGPQQLYSIGGASFMSDLVRLAGGLNIFADRPIPYLPVTDREVIEANPDIIIIDHPFQYKVGVARRDGWSTIAAVQRHRIFDAQDFDMILLNRPGPRIVQALSVLIGLFHPTEESHDRKPDQ